MFHISVWVAVPYSNVSASVSMAAFDSRVVHRRTYPTTAEPRSTLGTWSAFALGSCTSKSYAFSVQHSPTSSAAT